MELQSLQFQTHTDPAGFGHVNGYLGDQHVTHLAWDSNKTIDAMETHPDHRRQGRMMETWDAAKPVAGFLRHSPERTNAGQAFAKAETERRDGFLGKRSKAPGYHGLWTNEAGPSPKPRSR